METKANLLDLLEQYQAQFANETKSLQLFRDFLQTNEDGQLYDRKNFNGHITASAFILSPSLDSLLLLQHKKLNRWLQPGGHVDETDSSLTTAALRETQEETGLFADNLILIDTSGRNSIFDIDSHLIPANINKNEPAHLHHDMRFLFKCLQPELIIVNASEASGIKWVSVDELLSDDTFGHVARKIKTVVQSPKWVDV